MRKGLTILAIALLVSCAQGQGAAQAGSARRPAPLPTASPSPTPFVPNEGDMAWARRNLRLEPGAEELDLVFDYIQKMGPAAVPLLDDVLPFLELDGDGGSTCVAAVRAICAMGPKAARAIPSLLRVLRHTERTDEEGRILNECPRTVDAYIGEFGDAAFPYIYQVPAADEWLSRLAQGREGELLTRLRTGGPYIEAAAVALARRERSTTGVREALIEGHRAGHLADAAFIRAIQDLSDVTRVNSAVRLADLEPIVAGIAARSTDPLAKRDATRMLKLFSRYPPGRVGPPLIRLTLPPLEPTQPAAGPKGTPL